MARSQSPPGESKTPLIVGLVFSVLLLLGVGVLYYLSFDAVAKAEADQKTAVAEKTKFEKDLRAEQDKVRMYRALIGISKEAELTDLQNTSSKEAVAAEYKTASTQLAATVPALSATVSKEVGAPADPRAALPSWPAADKGTFDQGPAVSMSKALLEASARKALALKQKEQAEAREKQAADNYEKGAQAYAATVAELRKVATELPKQAQEAIAIIQSNYDEKAKNFDQSNRNSMLAMKQLTQDKDEAEIARQQAEAKAQKALTRAVRAEGDEQARANPFDYEQPHGKITSRRGDGTVTIDIGSSDNARPGLTFTVQPSDTPVRGLDSRKVITALPGGEEKVSIRDKGTIEIVNVTGPSSSTARITGEPNPVREGIMRNDVLYNPVWRKGAPDHVVLFGVFDMDGDGSDDIRTVVRDLSNVGVVVDAYYDLRAQAPVGKFNQSTAVAVEGYYPVVLGADGQAAAKTELRTKLDAYKNELLGTGIKVVKARDFFPRTGYPMKLNVEQREINRAFNPYLAAGGGK